MSRAAQIVVLNIGKKEIEQQIYFEEILNNMDICFAQFQKRDLEYIKNNYYKTVRFLCTISQRTKTEIVTGLLYRSVSNRVIEQSIYINALGKIKGCVSKKFDGKQLSHMEQFDVFETTVGVIGIVLGKDLWNVEIPRIMSLKGAELIFASDIRLQDNECEEEYIRGIAIYNLLNIIYCRQEDNLTKLIYATPKNDFIKDNLTEVKFKDYVIDMGIVEDIRKPDLSFKHTMWWLLHGRKPKMYEEILNPFNSDIN